MAPELDRRTYDLLRLVDRHSPIGSIQLVELMQLHGYDIKDRTIRLTLSELDELGLTAKVPGQGRRLTQRGRDELEQGDVSSRLEQIRARIAALTSRVSYDPLEDTGALVTSAAYLDEDAVDEALDLVASLESLPLGPIPIALEDSAESEPGDVRLLVPSSITLDGVLLAHGVNADLATAGLLEYEPVAVSERLGGDSAAAGEGDAIGDGAGESERASANKNEDPRLDIQSGGRIVRYVDVINGEGSSIDVISLLIESGRTDVRSVLEGEGSGLLVGDGRQFPINRYEEARDLAVASRDAIGGVLDFQRPREQDKLPNGSSAWAFGSLTYVGVGELLLSALSEYDVTTEWDTLYGTAERSMFESVETVVPAPLDD
ncbi:ribonuclease R [Natrialba magadii ATCC 43099]|uniref:Ribonuclease R n=1 Tax=Natrialba magadii (strain ATCC 43099 / DSM 3394 / CCM 3739 / CIP 104546 / IAM 13178 / JCM 8861 / NBRC 102185 / NCIMB 2190 / MS3) TaxID=547559 RepID=D3SUV1_NATMM|nr:NrpR regulatory domain-containing protein [Natrialba magadii]ADD05359.1 ribonuclease R [Natrialba magadii ATCC 43099]ELY29323.1 ribonuclease R [Natrialba magadii ATCC 43099]